MKFHDFCESSKKCTKFKGSCTKIRRFYSIMTHVKSVADRFRTLCRNQKVENRMATFYFHLIQNRINAALH